MFQSVARSSLVVSLSMLAIACSGAETSARAPTSAGPSSSGGQSPATETGAEATEPTAPTAPIAKVEELAPGTAEVTGSVADIDLSTLTTAFVVEAMPGTRVVVLAEPGEPCRPTDRPHLVLYTCKVGSPANVRDGEPDCGSHPDSGAALLEAATDIASANRGTIASSASASAFSGEFTLGFGEAAVSGRYHATICPADD